MECPLVERPRCCARILTCARSCEASYETGRIEQIVHAEVWIAAGDEVKATHVLLIVDLNDIGMVECEIHALDKRLSIQFNVPGAFRPLIESQRDNLMQIIRKLGYGIDRVHVVEKTQTRSLLDVFPHLQALQTGIDTYA